MNRRSIFKRALADVAALVGFTAKPPPIPNGIVAVGFDSGLTCGDRAVYTLTELKDGVFHTRAISEEEFAAHAKKSEGTWFQVI